jgi:hypothetical protein
MTFARVAAAARRGLDLWRGIKPADVPPADPGDLGAGTYWTSARARARCYGTTVIRRRLRFENPLVLSQGAAYDLGEQFGSLSAGRAEQTRRALAMRAWLKARGHDALIAVREYSRRERGAYTELEVVDLR